MPDAAPSAPRGVAHVVAALLIAALAVLAIAGAVVLPLGGLHAPEAGFVPLVEAGLLALFGLVLVVQAVRGKGSVPAQWPAGDARRRVLGSSAGLVAYAAILPWAGFAAATFLYLWFAIAWWKRHSPVAAALYAGVIALGLHLVFVVMLKMSLPAGAW